MYWWSVSVVVVKCFINMPRDRIHDPHESNRGSLCRPARHTRTLQGTVYALMTIH